MNTQSLEQAILGETDEDILLGTSEENRLAIQRLVSQANQRLDIFSAVLDPRLFDNPSFIESTRSLAISSPRARIRILLKNPDSMIKQGHRILELSRHLTSSVALRQVHRDYASHSGSFLLVDKRGVIERKHADRYEGIVNFNNPRLAQELGDLFDEIWEHSQALTDFRRLHI